MPTLLDQLETTEQTMFEAFDEANPKIWELFKKYAHALLRRGITHWSADNILHKIRFETAVKGKGDTFKINNNFSAFYARKFLNMYPACKGFFELRKSKLDND